MNNDVYSWGANSSGQLGLGYKSKNNGPTQCLLLPNEIIVDIKCGYYHSLILTINQSVYSCGTNYDGQLGREVPKGYTFEKIPNLFEIIKIECGKEHSMFIDANNNLFIVGNNENGQLGLGDIAIIKKPIKHPSLSNVIDISKGGNHTFVKTLNNEIYAFGKNECFSVGD